MRENKIIPNKQSFKAHPYTKKQLIYICLFLYVGCLIADNLQQIFTYLNILQK